MPWDVNNHPDQTFYQHAILSKIEIAMWERKLSMCLWSYDNEMSCDSRSRLRQTSTPQSKSWKNMVKEIADKFDRMKNNSYAKCNLQFGCAGMSLV